MTAALGRTGLLGLLLGYGYWLSLHPVGIGSNDALFFVRAIERFSVVELSPHFPGYPGFVLFGRAVDGFVGDPAQALFLVSLIAALSIPLGIYVLVRDAGGTRPLAALVAAAAALQPILPGLSLSLLSDALGLALLLWQLVLIGRGRYGLAGVSGGLCIAARPSYAVAIVAVALAVAYFRRDKLGRFVVASAVTGSLFAPFVLMADGMAYLSEALRFTRGHFELWGRAPGASWSDALVELFTPAGLVIWTALFGLSILALRTARRERSFATAVTCGLATLGYGVWMWLAQNPEQLRHAAPIVFLGAAAIGLGLAQTKSRRLVYAAATVFLLHSGLQFATRVDWFAPRAPPLSRVSEALRAYPGATLVTRRNVEVLRRDHPELRILDATYVGSTEFLAARAEGVVLRLAALTDGDENGRESAAPSRTPARASIPDGLELVAIFPARFPGEHSLALYREGASAAAAGPRAREHLAAGSSRPAVAAR